MTTSTTATGGLRNDTGGTPAALLRSAVADVTGQQSAPGGRHGVGAPGLRGDAVQLVDVGTGNIGGDHDSFTGLVRRGRGGLSPTLETIRFALRSYKRIKGPQDSQPSNLWQTGGFMDAIDRQLIEALRLNGRSSWAGCPGRASRNG